MADERHDELAQVHRLVVRFGNELLQDGFTSVPNLVLTHYAILGISPAEMMFSIHVWQYWWTEKDPYPALQTIADRMSVTRRQVRNYTQSLKAKGYLVVNERTDQRLGQLTSEYDFGPMLDAVLFVRALLSKLSALAPKVQQAGLACSLGRVFSREGEEEIRASLDELIVQLRPTAPLVAHALQEESEAIVAAKAPRARSGTTPRKSASATPRKDSSEGGRKNPSEAPRKPASPEEYPVQEDPHKKNTQMQENSHNSNGFELVASMQKRTNFQNSKKRDKTGKFAALQDGVAEPVGSRRGRGFTAVAQVVASKALPPTAKHASGRPRKGAETAATAEDASYYHPTDITPSRRLRGRPPRATEQIEAVVELISGEFHNEDSLPSNVGQAARLWKSSGLSEDAFVGRLYEARSITKQRGDIQKRAQGEAGEHGLRNRMPYFFAVVRDLLGMKEAQESR